MPLADRLIVMNAGNVDQIGHPLDLYDRPATAFVAGFIGSPAMNLLAGRLDGRGVTIGDAVLPLAPPSGARDRRGVLRARPPPPPPPPPRPPALRGGRPARGAAPPRPPMPRADGAGGIAPPPPPLSP